MGHIIDALIVFILGLNVFTGFKKGLIRQVFTIIAFILGIVIAGQTYSIIAEGLQNYVPNENIANFLSFILIFIIVAVGIIVGGIFLQKVVAFSLLGWVDKTGGIIFALLKAGLIIGIILTLIARFPIFGIDGWLKDSLLSPYILQFMKIVSTLLPPDFFYDIKEWLKKYSGF